jgi:hypothetical protein
VAIGSIAIIVARIAGTTVRIAGLQVFRRNLAGALFRSIRRLLSMWADAGEDPLLK